MRKFTIVLLYLLLCHNTAWCYYAEKYQKDPEDPSVIRYYRYYSVVPFEIDPETGGIKDPSYNEFACWISYYIYLNKKTAEVHSCSMSFLPVDDNNERIFTLTILESVNYEGVDYPVTRIGNNALAESAITELVIPDCITEIGTGCLTWSCISKVTFPSWCTEIPRGTFYGCGFLTSFDIPLAVTSIGAGAFGMTNIEEINLHDNITSIQKSAFEDCDRLKSVKLPHSLTFIGDGAFNGCEILKDVYCYAETPPILEENQRWWPTFPYDGCTLHVPYSSMKIYQSSEKWSQFGKIVPIEGNIDSVDDLKIDTNVAGTAPSAIYDLQGRRVDDKSNGITRKGIYITKGRKVIIRK